MIFDNKHCKNKRNPRSKGDRKSQIPPQLHLPLHCQPAHSEWQPDVSGLDRRRDRQRWFLIHFLTTKKRMTTARIPNMTKLYVVMTASSRPLAAFQLLPRK